MTDSNDDLQSRPSGGRLGLWKDNENGTQERAVITLNRADTLGQSEFGICWMYPPDEAWSPSFYLSERGLDNIHIYFWITKDFCWVQSLLFPGLIIGSLAVLYALFLSFRAVVWRKNIGEFWIKFAEFLWLFANFWWMIGELHDDHFGYFDTDKSIVDKHTHEAGVIFICTLVWISLFYLFLKPLNLLEETPEERLSNDPTGITLKPRFSFFFKTWNEYECVHIFFWVGKDTAWNWWLQSMWLVFFIPTFLIGLDFVYLTLKSKRMLIDHAHYFAQYMWVLANAVWAGGEFWFTPNNDSAIPVSRFSSEARHTSRWYSSWVVLGAYIPLAALYVLWIYYTYFGVIPPVKRKAYDTSDAGVYCDSEDSVTQSETSQSTTTLVANPLVPMREVTVQPTVDASGQSGSTTASRNTFLVSTSRSLKHDASRHITGNVSENVEIRLSELSGSDCVINGAEV